MRELSQRVLPAALVALLSFCVLPSTSARAAAPAAAAGANNLFNKPRFPEHPRAPAPVIAAGKSLFSANCTFCHGSNARGGEGGPNLLRSDVVLNDQNGEAIAQVVQNGRVEQGMPRFTLSLAQVQQIAAYLHSMPLVDRGSAADVNPVTGNAQAGASFFSGAGGCTACHSASGDLAGIGAKMQPRALERAMMSGGWTGSGFSAVPNMVPPGTTASVTLASGRNVQGKLDAIDEFSISLITPDGQRVTFERQSAKTPEVVIHNPLREHLTMLRTLSDDQVHNLTAYLVTLK